MILELTTMAAIESPCDKICLLDDATGLCRGCGRNINEIAQWSAYSDAERANIMSQLRLRLAAIRAIADHAVT